MVETSQYVCAIYFCLRDHLSLSFSYIRMKLVCLPARHSLSLIGENEQSNDIRWDFSLSLSLFCLYWFEDLGRKYWVKRWLSVCDNVLGWNLSWPTRYVCAMKMISWKQVFEIALNFSLILFSSFFVEWNKARWKWFFRRLKKKVFMGKLTLITHH